MKKFHYKGIGEWLLLAAFLGIVVLVFQQVATSLTEQNAASGDAFSNSALFPELVVEVIMVLVVLQALLLIRGEGNKEVDVDTATQATPAETPAQTQTMLLSMIGLTLLYLLALVPLGYHITTSLVMAGMFMALGTRPLLLALCLGAGVSLLVSLVFEGLLKVVLPVGVFNISLPVGLGG